MDSIRERTTNFWMWARQSEEAREKLHNLELYSFYVSPHTVRSKKTWRGRDVSCFWNVWVTYLIFWWEKLKEIGCSEDPKPY